MSIYLLATPLVVLALVNLLKRFGVSGAGPLAGAAVLFGMCLAAADYGFLGTEPHTAAGWYTAIAAGLILGLTAAGLYDVASTIGSGKTATEATLDEVTGGDAVEAIGETTIYDPVGESVAEDTSGTPPNESEDVIPA